jgi:hypothetical protein
MSIVSPSASHSVSGSALRPARSPSASVSASSHIATQTGPTVCRVDDQNFLTSERAALVNFLDAQRQGLIRKVEGLDDAQARTAPTASSLSLLGLVKHSATWEQRWFGVVIAGREVLDGWPGVRTDPRDADLFVDDTDTVNGWVAAYRNAIAESNAIVADLDLDSRCARDDIIECNVRYVLYHMIEETARHAGHADIIRETIDGTKGF